MGDSLLRRFGPALAIALALVTLVAVNRIADEALAGWRFDLTEDGRFTLDPATRTVLDGIPEPVTLRLYLSDRIGDASPSLAAFARRVRERLEEYALAAPGRLLVETVDPQPFGVAEDEAVAAGLAGIPLGRDGDTSYFGLVGRNLVDDRVVVPLFRQEDEGELDYRLTRLIARLAAPERRQIAVLSGLPLAGGLGPGGRAISGFRLFGEIEADFEVRLLAAGDLAGPAPLDPAATSVLVLVQPRDLPTETLRAIERYVRSGGRALVFVDPLSEAERTRQRQAGLAGLSYGTLGLLGTAWGVDLAIGQVAADRAIAS
jgi:ABC-type uncharacterized transport system involved in gliding motility auxiliary subunit